MSYWSLRRAAERAAAGHELARTDDGSMVPATRPATDGFGVPLGRPVVERHAATVTSPRRTLRERAVELEQTIWVVPSVDPLAAEAGVPGTVRAGIRSRW